VTAQLVRPDWAIAPGTDETAATALDTHDVRGDRSVRPYEFPEVADLGDHPPVVHDPAWETGYRDGHVQGRREGHEAGRIEGLSLGRAQAQAAAEQAIAGLNAQLELLGRYQAEQLDQLEAQVVTLALELAEMVVGHHVAASSDPGADALARALGAVRPTGRVVARMNPEDLDLMGEPPAGVRLELVPDPTVSRGGCVLDTGASTIDASLDGALDRVREVLLGTTDEAAS
jgi:flagellar assembly protein FliH